MAEPRKHCLLVADVVPVPLLCPLTLPADASIALALALARQLLGVRAADWDAAPVGIWGRAQERSAVPADGDRIELYRALPADPRQRRRQRARGVPRRA